MSFQILKGQRLEGAAACFLLALLFSLSLPLGVTSGQWILAGHLDLASLAR
ncbi:hypothetical protein D3C78_1889450 [compost metagenome]